MAMIIPYFVPLFLGMTFDGKTTAPGIDIYDAEYVDNPKIQDIGKTTSYYKLTTSIADVLDTINIKGDLSLKVKAGIVNVQGKGEFIKSSMDTLNKVEILTHMVYRSKVKYLESKAKPRDGWTLYSRSQLGTHYVSSITYGAELIASVRFVVEKQEDLQSIQGAVEGTFGPEGDASKLVAQGEMEKLQKQIAGKARLEISYYGTVPISSVPNTIDGLRTLVSEFKKHIDETGLGEGIPMDIELQPLSSLTSVLEEKQKFAFLKNDALDDMLKPFEAELDELRLARTELYDFVKTLPASLRSEDISKISELSARITKILRVYYEVIFKLDITKGIEQVEPARNAYREGGPKERNKFLKLVRILVGQMKEKGRQDGKHLQGVGLLLSRHASDALLGYDCINERFLTAKFRTKIKDLNVICCYAPTEDSDENEKDTFYSQLQDILNSVKKGDISLVLGDFNAKVGTDSDLWAGVLGPFGIGSSNGNGERLLSREDVSSGTYVHWGNNTCTAKGAKVLYQGYTVSSVEEGFGGGSKYMCFPKDIQSGHVIDQSIQESSLVGGIRYTRLDKNANPFQGQHSKNISGQGVPCALCYQEESADIITFSGFSECPMPWETQYDGYLMSARDGMGHTTEYVCVDKIPSKPYGIQSPAGDKDILAFTSIQSKGSLPVSDFPRGSLIQCAVCALNNGETVIQ